MKNRAWFMLIGGAAGAATGILAAWLIAPNSGGEVRRGLRAGARTLGSAAQGRLAKGRLRMTELVASGAGIARQMRDRAGDVTGTLKDQAERARGQAGRLQEQVGNLKEHASRLARQAGGIREQPSGQGEVETEAPSSKDILDQAADALGKAQSALEAIRRIYTGSH